MSSFARKEPRWISGLAIVVALLPIPACRGSKSDSPPIHLQQNMDFQARFDAQKENSFFPDRRSMRPQPAHTLLWKGQIQGSRKASTPTLSAASLDQSMLERGRERYQIYCSRCHGLAGDGDGILRTRNILVPPTSYLEPQVRQQSMEHFLSVIEKGIRNMPALGHQIPRADREKIAVHIRVLQLAAGKTPATQGSDQRASSGSVTAKRESPTKGALQ